MTIKRGKFIKVTTNNLNKLKQWFITYTNNYMQGIDSVNINLKIQHSLRVCKDIVTIGKNLDLSDEDLILAEISALLHDIARFEQYRQFKTYNDKDSFDHAKTGYEILKKENILADFDEYSQELILKSVLYHNRMHLPDIEDQRILFFTKLLRDANKLDIYKVVTDYYQLPDSQRNETIELGLDNSDNFTDDILKAVMQKKAVNYNHAKYLNDFKILQAGWVFNINFSPTLKLLEERGYLAILRSVLPVDSRIDKLFYQINLYIQDQVN